MNPSFRGGEVSAARRPFSRRPAYYIVNEFEQVRKGGFLVNKFEQVWGQAWVGGIPCKWEARDEGVPSEQV